MQFYIVIATNSDIDFMIDETAKRIIKEGGTQVRVKRSGMLQMLSFKIKKVYIGKDYYVELHSERVLAFSELQRVANETQLPVEVENGRAFPEGKGAKDFLNIQVDS